MCRYLFTFIIVILAVVFLAGCGSNDPAYLSPGEGTGSYLDQGSQQDQVIIADISEIRSALLAYAQVKNVFPPSIKDLVPNYLEGVPINPFTGEPYDYKGDLLGSDYELKYKLSDGKEYTANLKTTDLQFKKEFDKPDLK